MELRNIYAIYVGLGVILVLVFITFLKLNKKKDFAKGKKAVVPDYIAKDSFYKRRIITYRIYKTITGIACILSICAASVLAARPYSKKMIVEEQYSRDILICMDISTSVDVLNEELVGQMKEAVADLEGERVGIVIFNTTPVILCPLTTDYDYIIDVLDKVEQALAVRTDLYSDDAYDAIYNMDYDDYVEWIMMDDYISAGTLVGNEQRGSSLIGDGLAATAYDFPNLQDDKDRVRIIIFTSDNALEGTPLVTTTEAAQICKDNNIIVYGIGTEIMEDDDREAMEEAVKLTGGNFYLEEEDGSMKQIVSDIDKQGRNLIKVEQHCEETEHPEVPLVVLLSSVAVMFVFLKLSKR